MNARQTFARCAPRRRSVRRGWGVFELSDGSVHVTPTIGDVIARDHELDTDCWCRPTLERDGPEDPPVVSHSEPSWPGADR